MEKTKPWFYPLYSMWDEETYILLEALKKVPIAVYFNQKSLNKFFKNVIISLKGEDWRSFLDDIKNQLETGSLFLAKVKTPKLKRGLQKWAFFKQDKELCELVDQLAGKEIRVKASKKDVAEFVLRFLQTELLHDWRGPKMAILYHAKEKTVDLKKLNKVLRNWDFTGLIRR